tara:strand:+ start:254 stop:796 length:543 start_codon:yes stop_codon:yes gene_type:complete
MKSIFKILLSVLVVFSFSSCAIQSIENYENEKPSFDLQEFFDGNTTGWGIVQDRSGTVTRRFVVEILGKFNGNEGTLDEQFKWSDGKVEQRIWKLNKVNSKQWIGTADDVVGKAVGTISGNTLKWEYILKLPLENGSINVKFDDWMYLVDENVLMNKAKFSKFGFVLGEVTLSFVKSGNL